MNIKEAKRIIEEEGLQQINWYDEDNLRENQVGIKLDNGKWTVFVTDERASIVLGSIKNFNSEEEALDVLIQKARYSKEFLK